MDIKNTLIEKATSGKLISSMSNSSKVIKINKMRERTFSKWKVESMIKYHSPRHP
jgi:hypothetical protein